MVSGDDLDYLGVVYQVRLDTGWKNLPAQQSAAIDEHAAHGDIRFEIEFRGYMYRVDLDRQERTNMDDGKTHPLRMLKDRHGSSHSFPMSSDSLVSSSSFQLTDTSRCPNGHALKERGFFLTLHSCHSCRAYLRRDVTWYGCRLCMFDLCATCRRGGALVPLARGFGAIAGPKPFIGAAEVAASFKKNLSYETEAPTGIDDDELKHRLNWLRRILETPSLRLAHQDSARLLVELATSSLVERMSLVTNGWVNREEWIHYWFLLRAAPSEFALRIVQDGLRKYVSGSREIGDLVERFVDADTEREGEISPTSMSAVCRRYLSQRMWRATLPGAKRWLERADENEGSDHDEDMTLNYFEFIAQLIGREQEDVWLFQYDITAGRVQWAAPLVLGQKMEGIWHTGVVAFGREYWYGGEVFESVPGTTPFGKPKYKNYLGRTLYNKGELADKIRYHLAGEYSPQAYDVLSHNCNHFSDDVAMFLCHEHIPDEVRLQPEQFVNSVAAAAIRRLFNDWLGGFGESVKAFKSGKVSKEADAESTWDEIGLGSLVHFTAAGAATVTAEVLLRTSTTCDVWWFQVCGDSAHGRFVEAQRVPRSQVKPLMRNTPRRDCPGAGRHQDICDFLHMGDG